MAAYSLVLDFDFIQRGVNNRAPRKFGWSGAFGIMVTVVWLYVELLRIFAILREQLALAARKRAAPHRGAALSSIRRHDSASPRRRRAASR